ncbi:hypothetical protein XH97_29560 [Bradyrhizobium sp. CCBAU 53380]|nr:hypothetical protein [Bradyrhizobium sp. CCBAU 53380]
MAFDPFLAALALGNGLVFFGEDVGRVLKSLFAFFGEETRAGLAAKGDVPVFSELLCLTASSMLDDVDSLSVDPTQLPTGRFYFYDASRGEKRLLQAHIAPGVNLSDYW